MRSNGVANPIKIWAGGAKAQTLASLVGVGGTNLTPIIPVEYAQAPSAASGAQRGFNVRMFQATMSSGYLSYDNDSRVEPQISGTLTNLATGKPYDNIMDLFIPPKQFNSWVLDMSNLMWIPPIEKPNDGKLYDWDESTVSWREVVNDPV